MNFDSIWCWIIPLLVGAICALLGYLWGKGKRELHDNSSELKVLEEQNAKLKSDLNACIKKQNEDAISTTKIAASSLAATAGVPFDAAAAKAAFGKRIKQDDLKLVEGIGPQIEGLFHDFDIKTWKALSEISVDKCQEVLKSGGDRYRIHDPSSWPMQAKMAYEGKWKDLVKWQDDHKGGKF